MKQTNNKQNKKQQKNKVAKDNSTIKRLEAASSYRKPVTKDLAQFVAQSKHALAVSHKPAKKASPHTILTPTEHTHQSFVAGVSDDIFEHNANNNIETSTECVGWTSHYAYPMTIGATTSQTIAINSAVGSTLEGGQAKWFACERLRLNSSGTPGSGSPCVVNSSLAQPTPVVHGNNAPTSGDPADLFCLSYTQVSDPFVGAPANWWAPTQSPACPFGCFPGGGDELRWQLARIRLKIVNETKGTDKGGEAFVFQPKDRLTNGAVPMDSISTVSAMKRGIFKSYDQMNVVSGRKDTDGYEVFSVKDTLQAYHCVAADLTRVETHVSNAALLCLLSNTTGAAQKLRIFIKLDWKLAGSAIRGIGQSTFPSKAEADLHASVNRAMFEANVVPTEQKEAGAIASGMKYAHDRSLQLSHGDSTAASVGKTVGRFLGQHARSLAASGFAAAKLAVAGALGA